MFSYHILTRNRVVMVQALCLFMKIDMKYMRQLPAISLGVIVTLSAIFWQCSKPEYAEVIDTVACPILPTAKKVKFESQYFQKKVIAKTKRFYEATNYKKAWLDQKQASKDFKAFVNEVMESYRYGINPDDYDIRDLEASIDQLYKNKKRTDDEISQLDIRVTTSFFLFTTHLLEGRIRNAGAADFIWKKGQPEEDDVMMLAKHQSANDLRKEIDKFHPKDPQYDKLREALKLYKDMSIADNIRAIAIKRKIKPGARDQAIVLIRKKLELTDYKGDSMPLDSLTYDKPLVEAVKNFQQRHGITADGIIDAETVRLLNIPLQNKAERIALNLERLRWRPHASTEKDQIIVNVPEYMLRVYRNNKKTLEMKAILGSEFNATPIFVDTLKYIVFSPTWNVPKSIMEEEFLPNLQANPEYYSTDFKFFKNGVEVDPTEEDWKAEDINVGEYQVVQNPGNLNALGNVKFVMPNNFNIYLHDTPGDGLFRKRERALSHGCIRLEKPVDLAVYLLQDNDDWNKKRIMEAMQEVEPKTVNLKKPYPVHIIYRTVWVDDNGKVNFRDDVYGHDERQLSLIKKSTGFKEAISKNE
jgi:L,D-transpeptidase YcbB